MDAVVDIMRAYGIAPSEKWVDDLAQFRFPTGEPRPGVFEYAYDLSFVFDVTARLGVPWKLGKCSPYSYLLTYLGFAWDLERQSVALPEAKRLKYLAKAEGFLDRIASGPVLMKDAMAVNGTLSHVAFVYPHGRAYLTNLSRFISTFHSEFAPRRPPPSVTFDLRWWISTLSVRGVARTLTPRGRPRDLGIWVDASTSWGVGIIIDGRWAGWRLVGGWHGESRDIGWAEMVAIELAACALECLGFADADFLLHSDNMGVVDAFLRGRSRNFQVNLSLRRTTLLSMALNLRILPEYVNTKLNLADPISRGELGDPALRLPAFSLPEELLPFLSYVS